MPPEGFIIQEDSMWGLQQRIKDLQHANSDLRAALYEIIETFSNPNLKDPEAITQAAKIAQKVLDDTKGTSY